MKYEIESKTKEYDKLLFSCRIADIETVKDYIDRYNYVNGLEKIRNPWELPLFQAIYSDSYYLVKLLLLKGADPNKITSDGTYSFASLHLAVKVRETRKEMEAMDEIIDLPLKVDIINLLLEFGANINIYNEEGYTPLDFSVIYDNPLAKEFLIKKSAKFSKRSINDSYFSDMFSKDEVYSVGFIETKYIPDKKLTFIQGFLEYNMTCHIDWKDKLFIDEQIIKYIEDGGDINEKNNFEQTALDYAEEIGHHVAVEYLLGIGAKRSSEL